MLPPTMRAAAGSRPTIDRQVVVLPHPDSPDKTDRFPLAQRKAHPVDRSDQADPPNEE